MENTLLRFYIDNRKHLPGIAFIVGISLLSGILKMLSATYWGRAVDYGIAGLVEEMLGCAVLMAAFILADCVRTALHYTIIGRVTESMFLEVRTRAFGKIMRGDVAVLERKFRTGDIAVRLNDDIDFLSIFSANHLSDFSRRIFSGLFGLVACIFLSWQMSVAYLVILPLSLWMVSAISRPVQAQSKSSMDDTGAAMGLASDMITGALTVKAFAGEEVLGQRFDRAIDRAYGQKVKSEKLAMKMTGVKYVATVMQTMCLFLVGSCLVSAGRLSAGAFISFVTLSGYITTAFEHSDYMLLCARRAPPVPAGITRLSTSRRNGRGWCGGPREKCPVRPRGCTLPMGLTAAGNPAAGMGTAAAMRR
nr:ABC transporter ATP-binding protein [uncultured Acetatifactor sp.]